MNDNDNTNPQPKPLNPTEALHEALLHTQPEARPEFRRALEDQLAARIVNSTPTPAPAAQPADERTIVMTMTTVPDVSMHLNGHEAYPAHESASESDMPSIETLTDVSHFRRFTLPLTLVAALVIGMLIFPTLMSMRDKNGNVGAIPPAFGVNPEVTTEATGTPSPTTPIVVAARHLTPGSVILVDDVVIHDWPTEYVPVNAIRELDLAYGQIVRADIYKDQPILTTFVTKELSDLSGVSVPTSTPQPIIEIVVASRHISRGQQINAEDVKNVVWEERYVPMNAIFRASDVIGQFARTDIFRESPILQTVLGTSPADAAQLADKLPSRLMAEVVVAIQSVAVGTVLDESMVATRLYPLIALPPGTFTELDEVIGQRAMTDLYREMPIIDTQIGVAYRIHYLMEGESPSEISEAYDVSIEEIVELNRLDRSPMLGVGDILILPPDENSGASTAAGDIYPAMAPIAIPLSRLTNQAENTGDGTDLVGFDPGSDVAIIRNRPETGIPSTRMTVIVPSARLISAELEVFANGYASFMVSSREAAVLNEILSTSDDSFTLYPIPETQPASAPVVIVVTPTPAPPTSPESAGILLPPGMRMIALPFDRLDSVAYAIQEGDYIDILYTPAGSDEPVTVVEAALVVHVGPIPADDSIMGNDTVVVTPEASQGSQGDIIAIAVSPRTAVALQSMFDGSLTFALRPAGQAAEAKTQQTFDLPLNLITNSEILPQVFEFVDVYATLWYLDVDGEFQRAVPETEGATRMTQVVVRDAQVTAVDEDAITVTLLVSDEEAATLSWVIGSRSPLILVASSTNPNRLNERMMTPIIVTATPAPTAMPDSARILLPVGARMVAMPLDRVMNMGNAIQAGDLIDIVRPNPDANELITVVQAARVVYVGEFPSDDFILGLDRVIGTPDASQGARPNIVAFAVSPDEAQALSALLDSDTPPPLTLRPRPFAQADREGMVDLSLDLIASDEGLPRIGDYVDVYATLLFINIDDEFQRIVPETESALKATQLVARDAFVVVVDKEANLIRLSVTEQEKMILANVAIWRAPITFVPSRGPGFGYGPRSTVPPMPTMIPVMTATPSP